MPVNSFWTISDNLLLLAETYICQGDWKLEYIQGDAPEVKKDARIIYQDFKGTYVLEMSEHFNFEKATPEKREMFDSLSTAISRIIHEYEGKNLFLSEHEAALLEKEERLRLLINTALDAIITIDAEGKILEWNKKAEETFGWTLEEVKGHRMSDYIVPEKYRQAHTRGISHYLQTGKGPVLNQRIEISAVNKQGVEFPIELAISPIKTSKGVTFSAFLRDITYRKEAQERREQLLTNLEWVNGELREFAYIVSHDLKAPLRAIGSLADWISEDYYHLFDDLGKEQINLLQGRIRRMYSLIDGIFEYSRVGRVEERKTKVNLNDIIRDIKNNIDCPPNFEILIENELPVLYWDPTRVYQVFQNLISDAIKYNDKQHGFVRISSQATRSYYLITVEDNGCGIEEKYFDKIFKIFQTLRPRDQVESTGVGLTLIKKIIELYGGNISLNSTPGEGTTFFLKIKNEDPETNQQ